MSALVLLCFFRCVSAVPEKRPTAAQLVAELGTLEDQVRYLVVICSTDE
jgi:hypothetical protein